MYSVKISRDPSRDEVDISLSAAGDRWQADVLSGLADLMRRHEILRLELSVGEPCLRIKAFPSEYLASIVRGLKELGFRVDCQ